MEAAVVKELHYTSVLLGRAVPELVRIGSSEPAGEEALAAMTRAQAKRNREEEERASKKEKGSGITCRGLSPAPITKDPVQGGMWPPRPVDDVVERNADAEQEITDAPGSDAEGKTIPWRVTVLVESMERN